MPSVLILCAHRPKRSPSQRYRFEQYLPFLEQQGFTFTFSFLLSEKDDVTFYAKGKFIAKVFILLKSLIIRFKDIGRFKNYDIIFIQREASFFGTAYFEKRAKRSGARVIFDFDDSIWLADTSPGNKKWEFIKKPSKLFDILPHCDRVIAGNRYLAAAALSFNKNTVVIPTTIDTHVHVPKAALRNNAALTIGWSGSISTVKHFETLLPVLTRIKERYKEKVQFKLIGDSSYFNERLKTETLAWTEASEVDALNSFDIGIMPLPDNEWSKGKCGLKALSYMACEVPSVLSAVGTNKDIIEHGINGFLVHTEQEWFDTLCRLIDDGELRTKIGKAGRKTVLEHYSVEANKNKYLEVFSHVRAR